MEPLLSGLSTFFPWLINYTIDISILICFIFIIKSIATKKLPAWWHYSLWIILLLRMILPCKFESSPLNIPSVVPISIDERLFETILIEEEIVASGFIPEISSGTQGWNLQVDDLLLFIWLGCAFIFGIYILIKNIKFQNDIKKEPLLTDKKVLNLLEECRKRMNIRTALKITLTTKVKSPALFGYIHPRLLLPAGVLEKLDYNELSYIFMHELGHLKRHDIGVSWIMTFLQIFQWFNPLVWIAFHQMRIDQESACDASVLSRIKHSNTIDYASTIVGFLENFCQNRKLPAMVGILENQAQIKKRITMIVNYRRYSKTMMLFSTILLVILGVTFFSFVGFAKAKHVQPGLDSSIIRNLPFEVPKDLIVKDTDTKYDKTVVWVTDSMEYTSVEPQKIVVKYDALQKNSGKEIQITMVEARNPIIKDEIEVFQSVEVTQNPSIGSQERVVKDKIIQERPVIKTQISLAEAQKTGERKNQAKSTEVTQNTSFTYKEDLIEDRVTQEKSVDERQKILFEAKNPYIKDEWESVRFSESSQKESTETLALVKEVINPSVEDRDIAKSPPVVELGNNQSTDAIQLSQNLNSTSKENSMNYLGLAGVAYYQSENPDNHVADISLTENKPDESNEYDIKEFDEEPKILSSCQPNYPYKAIAKGIEGRVMLRFVVDKAGRVQNPEVVSAEPEGIFEQSALDTVVKYKFKPARKDRKSVNSLVRLGISYSIKDNYLRFAQR